MRTWAFTVDDIGLDGYSSEAQLATILDFCDHHGIRATLFVVPRHNGVRIDTKPGYVRILRDAVARGHEVAQHGLDHDRFEMGIPPEMILMLPHEGPSRKFLAENRDKLADEHSVERIRKKLQTGRHILEDALGSRINGFRSAALQSCENMFTALAEEDYRYDSSTYLQKAGWDLLNGIAYTPQEITSERFASLQMPAVMKELPLTAEYTWYLQQEKFAQALALAIHDYGACMNAGIPFVPLCHVAPLQEGDPGLGFALYQELLGHMAQSGTPAESLTLGEITDTFTAPCGASGTESTHETQFQRQNQRMETNRHGG